MQPENEKDPYDQDAASWLESLSKYAPKQKPVSLWDALLSERNIYQAAYQRGGAKLLASLVFCELFVAHCIEVQEQAAEGAPRYIYKIRDGIDISLLNEIEQVVARNLTQLRGFQSLVEQASAELAQHQENFPTHTFSALATNGQAKAIRGLAGQYQWIIAEANSLNATTSGTGCY